MRVRQHYNIAFVTLLTLATSWTDIQAQTSLRWVKQIGGTNFEEQYSMALDESGNFYTSGFFMGTADFDPGPGTFNLTSTGIEDVFITKLDASGDLVWARRIGDIDFENSTCVAVDGEGNVYTTGVFKGSVDFDPGNGTHVLKSAGDFDVFILKLDTDGSFAWVRQLGGTGSDGGNTIKTDASGNVYTTGSFFGTIDFDSGVNSFTLTSSGNDNMFLTKLDASGNFLWARQLGGGKPTSLEVDNAGNSYITGSFAGTADFDPGTGNLSMTVVDGFDMFISKLDASGNLAWAKQVGGIGNESAGFIRADTDGNIYVTGIFTGSTDFDPGTGKYGLSATGVGDIFALKLDVSGGLVWAKQFASSTIGNANNSVGIDVDGSGNVYITGWFHEAVDFDPGPDSLNMTAAGSTGNGKVWDDLFVSKLDSSGDLVWAKQIGSRDGDEGKALMLDDSGNIYLTGVFTGTVDFDWGAGTHNLTVISSSTPPQNDLFVMKISQDPSGIQTQHGSAIGIKLFPNPTTGQFTLNFGKVYSEVFVSIHDVLGRHVTTIKQDAVSSLQLEIPGNSGIYLVEIRIENGMAGYFKVVKR